MVNIIIIMCLSQTTIVQELPKVADTGSLIFILWLLMLSMCLLVLIPIYSMHLCLSDYFSTQFYVLMSDNNSYCKYLILATISIE